MNEQKRYFSRELLNWYRANQRDLPWRRHSNPYYTWVSEIMLQQTRVETVKPYFERFIALFPTVEALAEAPEEEVLKAWEGLGYYSRARNLQAAAREVKEQYGGSIPDDKAKVSALKGIGPYTAGAIMSIAFNRPEPAVDGNVMRVLSRYFRLHDDIAKAGTRAHMEHLAQELIPEGCASEFNQALMELGALVCTPKSPACLPCPVMEHCAGRMAGEELMLPVKTKAKPPKPELRYAALVEGAGEHAGKVLARQRPDAGLLARMWELPHLLAPKTGGLLDLREEEAMEALRQGMQSEGVRLKPLQHWTDAEHTFSHIHWQMRVYRCGIEDASPAIAGGKYAWIGPEEMERLAFPNLFLRLLHAYFAEQRQHG
ncbi:MAG: A/G-specific adenine glycosylase [Paenibacillus dendritiformis]|uniref:A/G-specific adenine glycosylase n=1 Tax=uncultured Paenibacillus sp. TaxID=227322 RepID=UPI0025E12195|nr:A/G-specific adenine glycosylase [uncultured Paenibacillus sp.]MDU5141003.1 A/G-specific adenine glycosylase [Paenibacillus dendritiformis]